MKRLKRGLRSSTKNRKAKRKINKNKIKRGYKALRTIALILQNSFKKEENVRNK